ncbi:MAG: sugar phosphate isomerase/epimerase, partial [Clostridia bacterium]|nr:sugar phosphate isomerase/epimerase [Clostridia bacterium]
QAGGVDPVRMIERLGKRAMVLHYKDYKVDEETKRTGTYTEVGNGNLEWDLITAAAEKAGTLYAVVEQDTCPGDPFDSLKISYDYLTKKGFI